MYLQELLEQIIQQLFTVELSINIGTYLKVMLCNYTSLIMKAFRPLLMRAVSYHLLMRLIGVNKLFKNIATV